MKRVAEVLAFLEARGVASAMIGGAALAVHGIARSTIDIDLFTHDARVLEDGFWRGLREASTPEVRRGDSEDPLLGIVRWRGDEPVDLIVGRGRLAAEIVSRRQLVGLGRSSLPVVEAPDLILLKLIAGGPQDLLDVRLMLHADPGTWRRKVEQRMDSAPQEARSAWESMVAI